MAEIVITIDGPAGVGKTTVAKILAKKLGFKYFDTGAMYRALALAAQEKGITAEQTALLQKLAGELPLTFNQKENTFKVFLNDRDISELIRHPQIGMLASTISQIKEVREVFWEKQRKLAKEAQRAIFEGRDMGSIVFPDAPVKFFLTASSEIRAKRRLKQLKGLGKDVSYKEIYSSILQRDKQDSKRVIAPMQPAQDAIIIDTSNLGIENVVNLMYKHISNKLEDLGMDNREEKTDENSHSLEKDETQTLTTLYNESVKNLQPGEILEGKIVCIMKDHVMVDVGFKSEGAIPLAEFKDRKGNVSVEEGDNVEVLFEGVNERDGNISLSRKKALQILTWEKIAKLYEKGAPIRGEITARVKGGFTVDIGIPAFLPGSQVDIKPVRDYDSFVGKSYSFKIINYNPQLHNVILSRRQFLEEERERLKKQTLSKLKEGDVVYGRVKSITDYGVFIDLGGIDGLLHITDISWGRIGHPADRFEFGDEVKVKVLKFDREKEKIALGMKQLTPDPWENISQKYPVGAHIKGRVTNLADYGAFVEIEEGVEGLIHISEMCWSKHLKHPSEILSVGDIVETVVLDIDKKKRRLSLGIKQINPDPWEIVMEKYPVGSIIEGKIKSLTNFGIFVEVVPGLDGLVHISDISWTKRVRHPRELYKKGDKIKVKVLEINKDSGKIALGIKQLMPDPWAEVSEKFPVGSVITGKITHITDFGLFVKVDEDIEGLVHISEVSYEKVKNLEERFKVGEEIRVKVIKINPEERKLGLSIKQLEEEEEKAHWRKYLSGNRKIKLGDLVKTKQNNA